MKKNKSNKVYESKITVVIPKTDNNEIVSGLMKLTECLCKKTDYSGDFGMGGRYGYGINYENDVFMMRRHCWCDKDSCKSCYGTNPNFLYKPTGSKVFWYKWIGRNHEYNKYELPKNWLEKCLKSINKIKKENKNGRNTSGKSKKSKVKVSQSKRKKR